MNTINRRNFIRTSLLGGVAVSCINPLNRIATVFNPAGTPSEVSLTTGNNRADMAFRALQPYSKQIRQAIGDRRIVIKPNNVSIDVPLAATHVDTMEGVLEFLKSINKLDNVIIAESAANTDWLAADRVGIELMGIDFAKVGYLNFCAETGLGEADLSKIEIIGETLSNHIKTYKLSDNIDSQLVWMTRVS